MLLYEQLDAFVVRAQNFLKPVERFIKRHFPRPAYEVVGVGDDLFLRRERKIVLLRQSQLDRPRCGYARPDMTFDDITECRCKSQIPRDLHPCQGMFDPVGPGPAYIMEEASKPHQLTINWNREAFGNRQGGSGNG